MLKVSAFHATRCEVIIVVLGNEMLKVSAFHATRCEVIIIVVHAGAVKI